MMMNEREMKQRAQRQEIARRREMKRRRVIRNRIILASVVIALAMIITGVSIAHANRANAAVETDYEYTPTHEGVFVQLPHTVKGGESLGTIAANYIQQYGSTEAVDDVVNRIISFSGLDRKEATYHLQAGQKITVPLWIAEDRNPHHSGTTNCVEESQN